MTEPEKNDDMQLVERCRLGDERAFETLYARYRLPLFSYLHKLLAGNPSLVDDIFQQVWIKANRNCAQFGKATPAVSAGLNTCPNYDSP